MMFCKCPDCGLSLRFQGGKIFERDGKVYLTALACTGSDAHPHAVTAMLPHDPIYQAAHKIFFESGRIHFFVRSMPE